MKRLLRVLVVEDSDDDAQLLLRALRRGDYEISHLRVQTAAAMRKALADETWDLVVSDYSMPEFSAFGSLEVLKESGLDIPIFIVSGTIGEEVAVNVLKAGAHDFMAKGRLARLLPAIERELRDAEIRRRRREAEEAQRASDDRFRSLVESMDDLVFTLDRSGRIDGVFGRWPEREGLDPAGCLGEGLEAIALASESTPHGEFVERALSGHRVVYEWSMEAGEETRFFQTKLSPRRGPSGEVAGVVGVAREITEQKRVQAHLAVADRMASVGMISAAVAHEINNPLASVLGNLEFSREDVAELVPLAESSRLQGLLESLRDATEAAERIRDIVRDIRTLSRGDEDRPAPVDVRRVLESSLRMASAEVRQRAKVVRDFAPVPPAHACESRLGQVFLNLIVNAAQAIPEGSAEAQEIRVATYPAEDGRVVVEIADTGTGMSPEVLRRLFTPFFTTKPAGVGTGLGLTICQRIVSAVRGEITVESVVGEGTVFRVFLPAVASAEAARGGSEPGVPEPRRSRVLVVDDEPLVGAVVGRCLRGSNVVAARSAVEARDRIAAGERFDVVLCDLMMPEMSGMELHAEIARIAPEQAERMVFTTGGAFTPGARAFLDAVPNRLLEKPFDLQALRAVVGELLASHGAQRKAEG